MPYEKLLLGWLDLVAIVSPIDSDETRYDGNFSLSGLSNELALSIKWRDAIDVGDTSL